MCLVKRSKRGWAAVVLVGALGLAACNEQKATETPAPEAPSKAAAPVALQPVEPAPVDRRAEVPPEELAKFDHELEAIGEHIGQLRDDPESPNGETGQELKDKRSKITEELDKLRIAAEEQWQAARNQLQKALQQLTRRLDHLEMSESPVDEL